MHAAQAANPAAAVAESGARLGRGQRRSSSGSAGAQQPLSGAGQTNGKCDKCDRLGGSANSPTCVFFGRKRGELRWQPTAAELTDAAKPSAAALQQNWLERDSADFVDHGQVLRQSGVGLRCFYNSCCAALNLMRGADETRCSVDELIATCSHWFTSKDALRARITQSGELLHVAAAREGFNMELLSKVVLSAGDVRGAGGTFVAVAVAEAALSIACPHSLLTLP